MSITSGYNKYKRYTKLSDGTYKLVSQWTNSNTVEMDSGKTLQETLGNTTISGIGDGTVTGAIDSLNSNSLNLNENMVITRSSQNSNFNAVYIKNNSMMYIIFQWINKSSLATSGNAFWTLSEYYRPKTKYNGYCIAISNSGAWDTIGMVVETDGRMYHTSSTSRCAILGIIAFDQ